MQRYGKRYKLWQYAAMQASRYSKQVVQHTRRPSPPTVSTQQNTPLRTIVDAYQRVIQARNSGTATNKKIYSTINKMLEKATVIYSPYNLELGTCFRRQSPPQSRNSKLVLGTRNVFQNTVPPQSRNGCSTREHRDLSLPVTFQGRLTQYKI